MLVNLILSSQLSTLSSHLSSLFSNVQSSIFQLHPKPFPLLRPFFFNRVKNSNSLTLFHTNTHRKTLSRSLTHSHKPNHQVPFSLSLWFFLFDDVVLWWTSASSRVAMAEVLTSSNGGGSYDKSIDQSSHSNVREQDRFLPIAKISRIMKKALPTNGKTAKDAKETFQECVSDLG